MLTIQNLETDTSGVESRTADDPSPAFAKDRCANDVERPKATHRRRWLARETARYHHRQENQKSPDPACQQAYSNTTVSRRTSYCNSQGHSTHGESFEVSSQPPLPIRIDEELDLISRSSVDTIAEEVRQTIRNQSASAVTARGQGPLRLYTIGNRPLSSGTDYTRSPLSESRRDSSLYDYSTVSDQVTPPAMDIAQLTKAPIHSSSQMIAQYLRSSRLTTMLKLTRSPHASRDHPLTVSLSDLGSPTGVPLVVFLGLGCVRHIMGLYDEMAECMGVRLITIDRYVTQ